MVVLLQQPKVLDYKHSKFLMYRNMMMREADNKQLTVASLQQPKVFALKQSKLLQYQNKVMREAGRSQLTVCVLVAATQSVRL